MDVYCNHSFKQESTNHRVNMDYTIVDWKNLVTSWYNEFLPEVADDKAMFVRNAGIVYLNDISIASIESASCKFLARKVMDMSRTGNINIIIRESKPVNNIHLKQFLNLIETTNKIDDERRNKLLHLANRRYISTSRDVLMSQSKEFDEFLDKMFIFMSKSGLANTRFYSSESLGFNDICDVAKIFFPKSILSFADQIEGNTIKISSTNDVMIPISIKLMSGLSTTPTQFIDRIRKSVLLDFEKLI